MQSVVQVQQWQTYVESSRVKQSDGRVMQNEVDGGRAMVEVRRVKQSEVGPWESDVESTKVKQSHGSVMQSQVE